MKEQPYIELRNAPLYTTSDLESWYFLKYSNPEMENLEVRWVIVHKKRADGGDWWGVRCVFPDTNENAIPQIALEMELARVAIFQLKQTLQLEAMKGEA